jgi:hypothetical protein
MWRTANHLLAGLAFGSAFLLAGCGDTKKGADTSESRGGFPGPAGKQGGIVRRANEPQILNDLKLIGLAYHQYFGTHNKGPADIDQLAPFFDNDARLKKDLGPGGRYVFHWNLGITQMTQGTSNTILAYERDADADGNRAVVMGDGAPRVMGDQEFKATLKAQGK